MCYCTSSVIAKAKIMFGWGQRALKGNKQSLTLNLKQLLNFTNFLFIPLSSIFPILQNINIAYLNMYQRISLHEFRIWQQSFVTFKNSHTKGYMGILIQIGNLHLPFNTNWFQAFSTITGKRPHFILVIRKLKKESLLKAVFKNDTEISNLVAPESLHGYPTHFYHYANLILVQIKVKQYRNWFPEPPNGIAIT